MRKKPDESLTDNVDEYIDSWIEFVEPIRKATDTNVTAFGGGAYLEEKRIDKISPRVISLPTWFIERFNENFVDTEQPLFLVTITNNFHYEDGWEEYIVGIFLGSELAENAGKDALKSYKENFPLAKNASYHLHVFGLNEIRKDWEDE